MTHKILRLLAVLGMAAALIGVPATAQAAGASALAAFPTDEVIANPPTVLHCTKPWLTIGYNDAIGQCTQVYGAVARPGMMINGRFSSDFGWYQLANPNWFVNWICADDGGCGWVGGWGVLATPYGATVFATQYSGEQGRWGNWNLHTNKFYPGGPWLDTL